MEVKQKKFLNALNIAFSPNPEAVIKILTEFSNPEETYNINKDSLEKFNFKQDTISNFLKKRNEINIEKEWQKLEKEDIRVITKDEEEYPPLLQEIAKPPALLYVKGKLLRNEKYLSCIGTRWPSDYGKMVTPDIVGDLANSGFTIVSGMARGIDTLSHKAALEKQRLARQSPNGSSLMAGGRTIAVWGTGIDIIFPPENKNLAKDIGKNGTIISEFSLKTPGLQYNFPLRNRIIAGMSMGTLVFEAKEKSGALITANLALEEGREVFAVPGPIYSKTSTGCNSLIKQGAHPVTSAEDILSVFNIEKGMKLEKEIKGSTKEEELILDLLKNDPCSIDKIIKETKIEPSLVNSTLILMEIEKKVRKTGEKYYINNNK